MKLRKFLATLALGATIALGAVSPADAVIVPPSKPRNFEAWGGAVGSEPGQPSNGHYINLMWRKPRRSGGSELTKYEVRCVVLSVRSAESRMYAGWKFKVAFPIEYGRVGMPGGADAPGDFKWRCSIRVKNTEYFSEWNTAPDFWVKYHP